MPYVTPCCQRPTLPPAVMPGRARHCDGCGSYVKPDSVLSTDLVLSDGTTYSGRLRFDDDGRPIVNMAECGACGFRWNDALCTSLTPAPSARCPNEYNHDDEEA